MPEPEAKQQECPVCHAVVPVNPGYVTWCDSCGWNLSPEQPEGSRGVLASLNVSLGRKQSDALLAYFLRTGARRPAFTWTLFLALVLSTAVHSMTVGFFLLGLLALVRGWPYLLAIVGGALCIALAWALRPRSAKAPETLARAGYPKLYGLADTVAMVLHAPRVDGIVVDETFSVAFGQVGWRRKRILYLGLPLWAILDAQERVALVAHELAHGVNRDPSRGFFIGAALYSLASWHDLLYPRRLWNARLRAFAALPANLLLWGLSGLVWLVASLLQLLLWRDTQRAEYLADRLAAEVSGTAAALSALQKLHLEKTYLATMR